MAGAAGGRETKGGARASGLGALLAQRDELLDFLAALRRCGVRHAKIPGVGEFAIAAFGASELPAGAPHWAAPPLVVPDFSEPELSPEERAQRDKAAAEQHRQELERELLWSVG